jgi:hypothetical protein
LPAPALRRLQLRFGDNVILDQRRLQRGKVIGDARRRW